jgi:hypothetical protein
LIASCIFTLTISTMPRAASIVESPSGSAIFSLIARSAASLSRPSVPPASALPAL